MFKFIAITCLAVCWISSQAYAATVVPKNDVEKKIVDELSKAELSDAETEKMIAVHRRYSTSGKTLEDKRIESVSLYLFLLLFKFKKLVYSKITISSITYAKPSTWAIKPLNSLNHLNENNSNRSGKPWNGQKIFREKFGFGIHLMLTRTRI